VGAINDQAEQRYSRPPSMDEIPAIEKKLLLIYVGRY
jgi:hypothetical protein